MRILIVDDQPGPQNWVTNALEPDHEVVASSDPRDLIGRLAADREFDLALVDMIFPPQSQDSPGRVEGGLAAMKTLCSVRPRGIPFMVYASDIEANRTMFLVTAHEVFDAIAVVSKNSTSEEIREAVRAFEANPGARRFPRQYVFAEPVLPRLIRNETYLDIWRAFVPTPRNTRALQRRSGHGRAVAHFLEDTEMWSAYEEITHMGGAAKAPGPGAERDERVQRFAALAAFAERHREFFVEPTLEELVVSKWRL